MDTSDTTNNTNTDPDPDTTNPDTNINPTDELALRRQLKQSLKEKSQIHKSANPTNTSTTNTNQTDDEMDATFITLKMPPIGDDMPVNIVDDGVTFQPDLSLQSYFVVDADDAEQLGIALIQMAHMWKIKTNYGQYSLCDDE